MNKVLIYNLNIYDFNSSEIVLDDFIINGNYKEFMTEQKNKLNKDIVNYKHYIQFFVFIDKYFNENNFALISDDYNSICYYDYEDIEDNVDIDICNLKIKEINFDFECEVYNCDKYTHKCSKQYGISVINNLLSSHIIKDKNFNIYVDDIKYELKITESYIQIMVRDTNDTNFKSIIKLQCHKFLYKELSIFDFSANKIVIITTLDSIMESKYKIAVTIPYICWNNLKQCIYNLLEHISSCYTDKNFYYEILNKFINYFGLLNNHLHILNNFQISDPKNDIMDLNVTDRIFNIDITTEKIEYYTFCVNCKIADISKKNIYMNKSRYYYLDAVIITHY